MKRKMKIFVLILILFATLSMVLGGCTTDGGGDDDDGNKIVIDIAKVLTGVHDTLSKTKKQAELAEIYSIDSTYNLDFAEYKYTFSLNANFNEKNPATSTIYLKFFDDEVNTNRIMLYYLDGTLYLDLLGERSVYPEFGSSGSFMIFYDAVRSMDVSKIFFSDEIIDNVFFLESFVDKERVSERTVGETGKFYEFTDMNLDLIKSKPNAFFKQFLAPFGDKLDALTIPLLGIGFSRIANFQLSTLTADKLAVASDKGLLKNLDFGFSGFLDSREEYDFRGTCKIGWSNREINFATDDDPNGSVDGIQKPPVYQDGNLGKYAFTGTLKLNIVGRDSDEYDIDMLLKTDENLNKNNKMAFLLKQKNSQEVAASVYYHDGNMYTDLGAMMDFLGNGFGLKEMGFPKVKTDEFNLSQLLGTTMAKIEELIKGLSIGGDFDKEGRDLLLRKISSDKKDGYFKILIDKELLTYFGGGEKNVIAYLATTFGIDEATAKRYFNSEIFDKIQMLIRINLAKRNVIVTLNDGTTDLLTLSLFATKYDDEKLERLIAQKEPEFSGYKEFTTPKDIGLKMSGDIHITSEADFSKFFGAFIGDAFGKNTPVVLQSTSIQFSVEALEKYDGTYQIHATVKEGARVYFELWSMNESGIAMLYVDYQMLGLKYKIPVVDVKNALSLALGDDNILVTGDLIEIFARILSVSSVELRENDIYIETFQASKDDDPLYDIFKIKGLTSMVSASVRYSFDDVSFEPSGKGDYIVPTFEPLPQKDFNSLYEAEWIEKVRINGMDLEMYIPYIPDSVKIKDGQTLYTPRGFLFGKEISYHMTIGGGISGTKEVIGIKNESLTIDPWAEVPMKDTLDVLFKDGEGSLPYRIDGFDSSMINPQGMDRKMFVVHFGTEKSILHKTLKMEIEVEVRTLDNSYTTENGYTVLGEDVSVNPLKFFENPYEILPKQMTLRFLDMRPDTSGAISEEKFFVEWEYDYATNMTLRGGSALARLTKLVRIKDGTASDTVYKVPKFAFRIIVQPKEFDHIKIMTEKGKDNYTVDVLQQSTYHIPNKSTLNQEIRIYFTDGTYSTVGADFIFEADSFRNSYLPDEIAWMYPQAVNIWQNGSVKPLGPTNTDTASYPMVTRFAETDIRIGEIALALEVIEPAAILIEQGSVRGVVGNTVENGVLSERKDGNFDYHKIDFGGGYGVPFEFDPYHPKALPAIIRVMINTATKQGEFNEEERTYPVRWSAVSNILDDGGMLRFPSAKETNFEVVGRIGDGRVNLDLSAVLYNKQSTYSSVEFFREKADGTETQMSSQAVNVTAYEPYLLPNLLVLTLEDGSKVKIRDVKWIWTENRQAVKTWSESKYQEYLAFLTTGQGNFNILDYYNNPAENDGVGFRFDNVSRAYEIEVSVSTQGINIYENSIPYAINVGDVPSARLRTPFGETNGDVTTIDPYSPAAASLITLLTGDKKNAPVIFKDGNSPAYLPVKWDAESLTTLLNRLKGGDNHAEITLSGMLFDTITGLSQSVTGRFVIIDRSISTDGGVRFAELSKQSADNLSYTMKLDGEEKTLSLMLLRPYAVLLQNGVISAPHEILKALLGTVNLVFQSGQTGNYSTRFDFLGLTVGEFNLRVLEFKNNVANTEVDFVVYFTEQGSTEDCIAVNLRTVSDIIGGFVASENLNRFNEDGTLAFPDGYMLATTISIPFSASGKIDLPLNSWTVRKSPAGSSLVVGDIIGMIPKSEFGGFSTRSYIIEADLSVLMLVGDELRDSIKIPHTFEIVAASITDGTQYNASSSYLHNGKDYNLKVESGLVTFGSIYDYYGFLNAGGGYDKAKLPTVVRPVNSGAYGQNNTFNVNWTMQSIASDFESYYSEEGVLAATAVVNGYETSTQTLKLYIRIAKKEPISVSKEGYDFSTQDGNFVLTVDPYRKVNGYSMWEMTLPSVVDVTLQSGETVSVSASAATYRVKGQSAAISKLFYNHQTFDLSGNGTLELEMRLEDGKVYPLTVNLVNKTVKSALFAYASDTERAAAENVLYLDPYAKDFAGLPSSALVRFIDGTEEQLQIELIPLGAEMNGSYLGGAYQYRFMLYGYRYDSNGNPIKVEPAQSFTIWVIVVPRVLTAEAKAKAEAKVLFADSIAAMLSDIVSCKDLKEVDFNKSAVTSMLPDGVTIPSDMKFVVPTLSHWYRGNVLATEKDFAPGQSFALRGNLSDRAAGEEIGVSVVLKTMEYDAIGVRNQSGDFVEENFIEIDVFNAQSVLKNYTLKFLSRDPTDPDAVNEDYFVDFTSLSTGDARHRIVWPESVKNAIGSAVNPGDSTITDSFQFGNSVKDVWYGSDVRTFGLMQIENLTVNLGYNGETDGVTQRTVYVYDPLHPVFPTEAVLTGEINGVRIALGTQNIDWRGYIASGSFYNASVQYRVTAKSKYTRFELDHYVEVLTLDRHEFMMLAGAVDITQETILDPAATSAYDAEKNEYILPREISMTFTGMPTRKELQTATDRYGRDFRLSGARWWLGKVDEGGIRKISIEGNEGNPWPMVLTAASFQRVGVSDIFAVANLPQTEDVKVNPFHTSLTVKNRSVSRTNITGDKVGNIFTAQTQYAIDPYNVDATLPLTIDVWLGGEMRSFRNPVWKITGDIRKEMIEGTTDKMLVSVELSVFADKVVINFPVKARPLAEQGLIRGGTFYVDYSGGDRLAIAKQLPKNMFFNFGYKLGSNDYTSVPLTFNTAAIPTGASLAPGVAFTMDGKLGQTTDKDNFRCIVIPVTPRYYALANVKDSDGVITEYRRLDFYYDMIPVPVNSAGSIIGSAAVKSALPDYLWLDKAVYPVKIMQKEFLYNADKTEATALVLTAAYSFRNNDEVNLNLAVDKNGGTEFNIRHTLPLRKYDTSKILKQPEIDRTTAGTDGFFHYALGTPLAFSKLPSAVSDANVFGIFWDFSNVNITKSGDYTVTGKLVVSDESVYNFSIGVYIDPVKVDVKEIYITADELSFTYSGAEKVFPVTLPTILREDGTTGKPSYYLTYAKEENPGDFIRQQFLDSGKYRVKVTLDDRNAVGERIFDFEIKKWKVSDIAWSDEKNFVYEKNTPRTPTVLRLPDWVKRTLVYREYDEDGYPSTLSSAPVNAGRYAVALSIPEQDNCEASGEPLSPIEFVITKQAPEYKVVKNMTYSGTFRHVTINGLPEILENGMTVNYRYFIQINNNWNSIGSDMIRNAGTYMVEADIVGGRNYTSQSALSGVFTIGRATLSVSISDIRGYYLQSLLPFTSGVKYSAPFGTDSLQNFSGLRLNSDVTERSFLGRYPFTVGEGSLVYSYNNTVYDNYDVRINGLSIADYNALADSDPRRAAYVIKETEGVKLIANAAELTAALSKLKAKDVVSYYLEAGNYGTVTLSVNADVTLTGCYGGDGAIAVTLDGFNAAKGIARLNLLRFTPKTAKISLYVGAAAGAVTVSRCLFSSTNPSAGTPPDSTAVYAVRGYLGTISLSDIEIAGYSVGINAEGGNLFLADVTVTSTGYGVISQSGTLEIERCLFEGATGAAVTVNGATGAKVAVTGSRFRNNVVALKYTRPLSADELELLLLTGENVYEYNGRDVVRG